ncbi:hypothetical protein [Fulvivirga sediminis]|uniref:Alpha/beta hydrolase n=1 Tax=Fulvivirga sediminis TaxID=2803949 RepID=A0A937JY74_9BACT|nr:hypothetical protein [Fulvivirga sediminis]MBL3655389.1 hypothetical protein [Fulvivirga sediminis]
MDENSIEQECFGDDNLLVSFGGVNQAYGIPVFEFKNVLKKIKCDKLFIRDLRQAWYHLDSDSNVNGLLKLKERLRERIGQGNYKRVVFLGSSMGGFAAIYFGSILRVDKIIAFSPQSFIDRFYRTIYVDRRWRSQIRELRIRADKSNEPNVCFDLKRHLENLNTECDIEILYAKKHRLDRIHSNRLKAIKGVNLMPMNSNDHSLVKDLRNSGDLYNIINRSLIIK